MADKPKEIRTEHKTTEVSEVQSFSGGEVHSIEPIEEGHTDLHVYSGGEILEYSSRPISPVIWGFWAVTIVVIIGVVLGSGAIPGLNKMMGMGYPTPAGELASYREQYQGQMSYEMPVTGQHAMIAMDSLPLPAGQDLTQAISSGQDIYTTYCVGCHGPNQDGAGPNSTTLDPKPRNLHDAPFMQAMSLERINTSIHKGVPGTAMPRWESQLSEDQIKDVIAYVFSLTAPTDAKGKFLTEAQIQAALNAPVPAPEPVATPNADIHSKGVNNTAPANPPTTPPAAAEGASVPPSSSSSTSALRSPGGSSDVAPTIRYNAKPAGSAPSKP